MFAYSPKIITNGLVLYLDAGNSLSYPGSGTIWTDLSRSQVSGSLLNGPTYNSANNGSIVFDGSNDYVDCGNNSSLNAPDEITLSAWINGTYNAPGEYAVIGKGGVAGHHFGVYQQKIIFQTTSGYRQSNTTLNSNLY